MQDAIETEFIHYHFPICHVILSPPDVTFFGSTSVLVRAYINYPFNGQFDIRVL